MGLFEHWPYVNFHELNLDWIIKEFPKVYASRDAAQASADASAESAAASQLSAEASHASADSSQLSAEASQQSSEASQQSAEASQQSAEDAAEVVKDTVDQIELLQSRVDNIIPQGTQTAGNTELLDIRVGYNAVTYDSAGNAVRGQIADIHNDINSFVNNVKSANLFNGNYEQGYVITNGSITQDPLYTCSDIQTLEAGTYLFKYSTIFGSNSLRCYRYADDNTFIDYIEGVDIGDNLCRFTLANKSNCRINIGTPSTPATWMIVSGTSAADWPEEYIEYYDYLQINENVKIPTYNKNPLYGKKLCCDGDSIMYGAGYQGGFAKIISENNNMTIQNIAVSGGTIRSGTTWSGGGNRHWICESLATLDADGDYYIFDGYVNDVNSQTVIGTITWGYDATLDTTTFCGAFEQCCKTLSTTYAGKKVGFIFPHRIWKPSDTLAQTFIDNMILILEKWGIPYINLIELDPPINDITALKDAYTNNGDGWHPNEMGYQLFYVDKITAWLKTL